MRVLHPTNPVNAMRRQATLQHPLACLRSLVCSVALGLSSFTASPAAAAPAAESESDERPVQTVRLLVQVDAEVGEDATHYRARMLEGIQPILANAGFELVDDVTADASVRVSLKVDDLDNFVFHLETEITVGDQHTALDHTKCEDCLLDKLYPAMDQQGPRIVDALRVARVHSGTQVVDSDVPPEAREVAAIGPLGGVGIGVAALGLGATIAGAVELSKGKVYDPNTIDSPNPQFTDHQPAGRALLGVGIASVAVGVALLVTDVAIRAKKRRNRQTSARAYFPVIDGDVFGVGLIQKF